MRRFVASLLALMSCLSLTQGVFAAEASPADRFDDVDEGAWYIEYLDYALEHDFVAGTSPTTFSPDDGVTKGQFVTMLGRAFGEPLESVGTTFGDVDVNAYYSPYVEWSVRHEYIRGLDTRTFAPDSVITVEQMAAILDNYITKSGVVLAGYEPCDEYVDKGNISAWAVSSMEKAREYGLITPYKNGKVYPQNAVSRAEAVASLVRLSKCIVYDMEPLHAEYNDPFEVTYENLLRGDYSLVTSHTIDNLDAIDNNIRYMIKNGVTEIELDVDWTYSYRTGSDYGDIYWEVMQRYPEFGYKFVRTNGLTGKLTVQIYGLPEDLDSLYEYQDEALQAAIEVRKGLWESGAITSSMTQLEKARVYYDWVVEHCDYDWESYYGAGTTPYAWISYGVVVRNLATCQGYTAAYNLFLRMEGIETLAVRVPTHIWTSAELDGVWYHSDPCWPDWKGGDPEEFFLMTPEWSMSREMSY